MAVAAGDRCGDGGNRLVVGIATPGHQKDLDQFDGFGQQRLLLPVDGIVLLLDRLQGAAEAYHVAEGVRDEFNRRLYVGQCHQLQMYRNVVVSRLGAIYRKLLSGIDCGFERIDYLCNFVVTL